MRDAVSMEGAPVVECGSTACKQADGILLVLLIYYSYPLYYDMWKITPPYLGNQEMYSDWFKQETEVYTLAHLLQQVFRPSLSEHTMHMYHHAINQSMMHGMKYS